LNVTGSKIVKVITRRAMKNSQDFRAGAWPALAGTCHSQLNRKQSEDLLHEIRGPLANMVGLSQLAMEQCEAPVVRGYLECIQRTSHHLLDVLGKALDNFTLEANGPRGTAQRFDLPSLLKDLLPLITAIAQSKGLRFACDADIAQLPNLVGDPTPVRQVLFNLLSNALKFTARGSVLLTVQLQRLANGGGRLYCQVRDTGIGIAPADWPLLFQRYSRVQGADKTASDGHGLGLSICQEILQGMGSSLRFESHPGTGSLFSFELPLAAEPDPPFAPMCGRLDVPGPQLALDEELERWHRQLKGMQVLIAEDNACDQQILQAFLHRAGIQTTLACTGQEALRVLQHQRFDALVLDTQMPGMDGPEVVRRIRNQAQLHDLGIIVLSAHGGAYIQQAYKGMQDCTVMTKPPVPLALLQALAQCPRAIIQSPVQDASVLDLAPLRLRLGDQEETLQAVLGVFKRHSTVQWHRLQKMLHCGNLSEAALLAHTLQGSAGNVGANALQAAAAMLHSTLQAGLVDNRLVDAFGQAYTSTMGALALVSAPRSSDTQTSAAVVGMQPPWRALEDALSNDDFISSTSLGRLRRALAPAQHPLFDQLCDHARDMQYPQAQRILQQLRA
jgi:two-component system sensor histidine kinase/response regulator FitF